MVGVLDLDCSGGHMTVCFCQNDCVKITPQLICFNTKMLMNEIILHSYYLLLLFFTQQYVLKSFFCEGTGLLYSF